MTSGTPPHDESGRQLGAVAALAGGEIVARVAAFAATSVLAHRLGPEGFGIVGFAAAVAGYLALAVNSSLHEVGAREIARAGDRAAEIYWSVAAVRLLLAVAAFALLSAVAWSLPKPPVTRLVVLLCGLSFFSLAVDPTWVLKGLERPVMAGVGLVLGQCLYAAGVLVVVRGPADVTWVPVVQFVGEILAALILCLLVVRPARPRFALADGLQVVRSSGYLGLARVFRVVAITSDVVLLGVLATDRQVGLYSAAYRLTFLLLSIAASVTAAYLPAYARAIGEREVTRRLLETSLGTSALVGAPLVAGTVILASPLMTFLFGAEYAEGAVALQLLALSVGVVFLYSGVSNVLITWHRSRLLAGIRGIAAVGTVALNVVVIPRWGFVGAAAVTLAGEMLVAVAGVLSLRQMHLLPSPRTLGVPVVAALCMSAVLGFATRDWPVVAQVAAGAVLYVSALTALGYAPRFVLRDVLTRLRSDGAAGTTGEP
ncbi:MAG: flippase [Vicinamibacteria bacterium]|nr:flippase [Vicinamibacteria bacterium]